jgi:hypothetical protein
VQAEKKAQGMKKAQGARHKAQGVKQKAYARAFFLCALRLAPREM